MPYSRVDAMFKRQIARVCNKNTLFSVGFVKVIFYYHVQWVASNKNAVFWCSSS